MATQTLNKTTLKLKTSKTVAAVRTARRAYLGLFGFAYDRAQLRTKQVREFSKTTFEDCVTRGDKIQTEVLDSAGEFTTKTEAQAKKVLNNAGHTLSKTTETVKSALPKTVRFKGPQITKLEAEVEALTAKLDRVSKAQMKTVAKNAKKAVKKPAKKTVSVKKTVAVAKPAKTVSPEPTPVQAKTAAVAPTPNFETSAPVAAKTASATVDMSSSAKAIVTATQTEMPESYMPYISDVRGYDANADASIIRKIVNHCGISLQSRDGKFVACSDEAERTTVRDSWLVKKLGVTGETAELDAKIMAVCETMQKDRMKNRVTFYYLVAKNENLLNTL